MEIREGDADEFVSRKVHFRPVTLSEDKEIRFCETCNLRFPMVATALDLERCSPKIWAFGGACKKFHVFSYEARGYCGSLCDGSTI